MRLLFWNIPGFALRAFGVGIAAASAAGAHSDPKRPDAALLGGDTHRATRKPTARTDLSAVESGASKTTKEIEMRRGF